MERFPNNSSESSDKPEKSGSEDTTKEKTTKKRKKTTKIAKKVAKKLVAVEQPERKSRQEVDQEQSKKAEKDPKEKTDTNKAVADAAGENSHPENAHESSEVPAGSSKETEVDGQKAATKAAKPKEGSKAGEVVAVEETPEGATSEQSADGKAEEKDGENEPVIFDRSKQAGDASAETVLRSQTERAEAAHTDIASEYPEASNEAAAEETAVLPRASEGAATHDREAAPSATKEAVETPVYYEDLEAPPVPPMPHVLRVLDPTTYVGESPSRHAKSLDTITRSEYDDAVYRAERHGIGRGVLGGGLFMWWLGRRSKRSALEEAGRKIDEQNTEIKKLRKEYGFVQERLRKVEAAKEQLPRREFVNYYKETTPVEPKPEHPAASMPRFEVVHTPKSAAEATLKAPKSVEKFPPNQVPKPELPPEEQPITEEMFKVPEGRRIETSTWHAIEVDEKTGKAVENPSRRYGEAFNNERQQERLHHQAAVATTATQLGHTILKNTTDSVKDNSTQSSTAQESPVAVPRIKTSITTQLKTSLKRDMPFIKQQFKRRTLDPMTWVIALLLVVLLFSVF